MLLKALRGPALLAVLGLSLSGCQLIPLQRNLRSAGCGDQIRLEPVAANQTLDSIRQITMQRAANNPRRSVQANVIADYGRGPTGRRLQTDVSLIASTDGRFARLRGSAEALVPTLDVLVQDGRFSVVNYGERTISRGTNPRLGSERAAFVPLATSVVQALDPLTALAQRFQRDGMPQMRQTSQGYFLQFRRADGRIEEWLLRRADLLPVRVEVMDGPAITSRVEIFGYQEAEDGSGPVPTCIRLLIDPGVELTVKVGEVRRNVVISPAARIQDRPADFRRIDI
jgi:hypothetical protein